LGMVTRTGTDNSTTELFRAQLTDHIVCAAQLVGTYHLHVFPFQVYLAVVFLR